MQCVLDSARDAGRHRTKQRESSRVDRFPDRLHWLRHARHRRCQLKETNAERREPVPPS
jgi:hypothetical protein